MKVNMIAVFVVVLVAMHSQVHAQSFPMVMSASLAADTADIATTRAALQRPWLHESNPLLAHGHLTAIKLGTSASMGVGLLVLHRQHPTLATWVAIGNTALKSWAAWHNYQLYRSARAR